MTRIALIASALAVLAGCGDFDSSRRREHLDQVAENLLLAYDRFDAGDFDGCVAFCQLILAKDPDFTGARELAEDAAKMKEREKLLVLKRAHVRELADALVRAFDRFDARDFDGCIACCAWVLSREPEYGVAVELAEDAEKYKGREEYYDFVQHKVNNWRKLTTTGDEAEVPYTDYLTYPHLAGFQPPSPTLRP